MLRRCCLRFTDVGIRAQEMKFLAESLWKGEIQTQAGLASEALCAYNRNPVKSKDSLFFLLLNVPIYKVPFGKKVINVQLYRLSKQLSRLLSVWTERGW